jgi:hypothetical protein
MLISLSSVGRCVSLVLIYIETAWLSTSFPKKDGDIFPVRMYTVPMPRPKKPPGGKHTAHQITFEPGQWEEVQALLPPGGKASALIQELLAEWIRKRKAEKAGEAWPAIEARLKRLEGKAPPRLDRRETDQG